jgi:hypothetical protein
LRLTIELGPQPRDRSVPIIATSARGFDIQPIEWSGDSPVDLLRCVEEAAGPLGIAKGDGFHLLRHFYASLLLDVYGHLWPEGEDLTRMAVDVTFKNFRNVEAVASNLHPPPPKKAQVTGLTVESP